jgi:hypothetical protein
MSECRCGCEKVFDKRSDPAHYGEAFSPELVSHHARIRELEAERDRAVVLVGRMLPYYPRERDGKLCDDSRCGSCPTQKEARRLLDSLKSESAPSNAKAEG